MVRFGAVMVWFGFPGKFQVLNKRLLVSNDSYLRTTSALHKETSQRLWQICADSGDIFLGKYEVSSLVKVIHSSLRHVV